MVGEYEKFARYGMAEKTIIDIRKFSDRPMLLEDNLEIKKFPLYLQLDEPNVTISLENHYTRFTKCMGCSYLQSVPDSKFK